MHHASACGRRNEKPIDRLRTRLTLPCSHHSEVSTVRFPAARWAAEEHDHHAGWGRLGDAYVVAWDTNGRRIGAAWYELALRFVSGQLRLPAKPPAIHMN